MATEVVIQGSYGSGCVPRQIVLLRGINLGSRNRIAMPELREMLEGAGFEDVQTYVQSGNVVLSSTASPTKVAETCRREIMRRFKLEIAVVVRTRNEPPAEAGAAAARVSAVAAISPRAILRSIVFSS